MYDSIDSKILQLLQRNGRVTQTELAAMVGLSSPAVAERIKKLEERGVIQGFQARLNPSALNLGLTAFVSLRVDQLSSIPAFLEFINRIPNVLECHRVTGEDGFLLKIRVKDMHELESVLIQRILTLPGVSHSRTSIALSTAKEETVLPLPQVAAYEAV
ncbi:Lrp/AsnC family transcriptional regulator [Heliophilum fasciatum]|uniref:Lrp/AsnC family leucine-responsive transcriptional regulator n=1 Tax=Heliophilum fasciatum TaxID=35700 RepID=A0A4V2SX18_9FIRM|nr:Lrp/AsnC family transcriptional regulator [Heliophilum fasciatum]MCW2278074.1 Lrp/AsnC family leucine-responsive transcriptional regulator [Heliophilum fasciatum]TCP64306.1 Lrp/AsnC family leucine-responsive transcriptional regulator [Heliophilum fasciatum]